MKVHKNFLQHPDERVVGVVAPMWKLIYTSCHDSQLIDSIESMFLAKTQVEEGIRCLQEVFDHTLKIKGKESEQIISLAEKISLLLHAKV